MTLNGWQKKYQEILNEFDYDRSKEIRISQYPQFTSKSKTEIKHVRKKN